VARPAGSIAAPIELPSRILPGGDVVVASNFQRDFSSRAIGVICLLSMKSPKCVLAIFPLALMILPVHASLLVLPNAETSALGNDSSGSLALSFTSGEFQDIWDSGQFSSVPGDLLITSLAFRLKPGTGSINATVTSFDIHLSTTTRTTSNMSTTFATNRGADYTDVLSGGVGTVWSSPGCSAALTTCPFDVVYTLTTPFFYDPTKGDLLLDFALVGYSGTGTGQFDVENFLTPGHAVSELTAIPAAATGSLEYSDNITQLGFTAVPEPASYGLILSGLGVFAAMRRRRSS
jgi:hypothetical protein